MNAIRWGDNDRYFGPFTYSPDDYWRLALVLGSGDDDDYPGCRLRLSLGRRTFIVVLPQIVQPWRRKVYPGAAWDAATVARLGRDWYYDTHEREYGFSYSDGFLQVFLGRQTHDSSTTQSWSKFIPWKQWRHVRHSLYDLRGEHFYTMPERRYRKPLSAWRNDWRAEEAIKNACPSATFAFKDYDGEELTATTRIEEREWHFGEGWFKWLSLFRRPKIERCIDIRFSGETGKRKGSWKGGTIGHGGPVLAGQLHEAAFRAYCAKHDMTFTGAAAEPEPVPA